MTKSTITREESIQAVFDLKVGYRLGFADIEILKRVASMALAAMDSEPVYQVEGTVEEDENGQVTKLEWVDVPHSVAVMACDEFGLLTRTLYKSPPPAQPAPVVPEEMPCGGAADDYHDGYQDGWNACRAAMKEVK